MAAIDGTKDLSRVTWRKSSRSNGGQDSCVEVAMLTSAVAIRDSKNPDGHAHVIRARAFRGLIARIKQGELGS
jgi:hypothetical protein